MRSKRISRPGRAGSVSRKQDEAARATSPRGSRRSSPRSGVGRALADASALYAIADEDAPTHEACLAAAESGIALSTPILVVAETAYLLATRLGAEAELRFVGSLASGDLPLEPVAPSDWLRIAELAGRYRDLRLDTVDASIIAAAERLGIRTIFTLDRRHFTVIRPRHVAAFELLP
jgi:predicted nucleic acid-binding protein